MLWETPLCREGPHGKRGGLSCVAGCCGVGRAPGGWRDGAEAPVPVCGFGSSLLFPMFPTALGGRGEAPAQLWLEVTAWLWPDPLGWGAPAIAVAAAASSFGAPAPLPGIPVGSAVTAALPAPWRWRLVSGATPGRPSFPKTSWPHTSGLASDSRSSAETGTLVSSWLAPHGFLGFLHVEFQLPRL